MDENVLAFLIALIPATISAFIAWWINSKNIKRAKSEFKVKQEEIRNQFEKSIHNQHTIKYKEIITAERVKWLNSFRESIVDYSVVLERFCSIHSRHIHKEISDEEYLNIMECELDNFNRCAYRIQYNLNRNEEEFIIAMNEVKIATNVVRNQAEMDYAKEMIGQFVDEATKLLKKEWEQIKKEANPYSTI